MKQTSNQSNCSKLFIFFIIFLKLSSVDGLLNLLALKKCISEKFRLPNIKGNIGWQQSQDYEDGMKYVHDEVTFRSRSGDTLDIPQAERYSTKDWVHNLLTMKNSRLLKRIRGVIIFNTFWSAAVYIFHLYIKFNAPGTDFPLLFCLFRNFTFF